MSILGAIVGYLKVVSNYQAFDNNELNIPSPTALTGSKDIVPYVLVVDDAFVLSIYLMKPYNKPI